jgi:hypothetical protein
VHGKGAIRWCFSVEISLLNLGKLQQWIDAGRIDPTKLITFKELLDSRTIHNIKDGVKLLGNGADYSKTPVDITVSRASASAIEAIEKPEVKSRRGSSTRRASSPIHTLIFMGSLRAWRGHSADLTLNTIGILPTEDI